MLSTIQSPYLTIPETAAYLRLPLSKVYELVRSKGFPSAKLGKTWRVHRGRLDAWWELQWEEKPENL